MGAVRQPQSQKRSLNSADVLSPNPQAMEAVRQLQRNMAAEAAIITAVSQSYGAVLTPHQSVCGDLAAWPQVVYMSRLVKHLGAPPVNFCALRVGRCLSARACDYSLRWR